jgi:hypothetical protein
MGKRTFGKGRLIDLERRFSFGEATGRLWRLIKEDTIMWGEPSEEEKASLRAQRYALFKDSAIPWIVSDAGALTGFIDDIQDILAFGIWNKRLIAKHLGKGGDVDGGFGRRKDDPDELGSFGRCMRNQSLKGRTGMAALSRCMCGRRGRQNKRRMKAMTPMDLSGLGPLLTLGLRLFPGTAPLMWALLAGQVAGSLFGYGIKLGPVIGFAMETFFRGADAVGLPFDRSHNKWFQLKIARGYQMLERGFGAARAMNWEDRLTMVAGTKIMLDNTRPLPAFIVDSKDYPTFDDLWDDPYGAVGNATVLLGSLAPNLAAYMVNDFIMPIIKGFSELGGGEDQPEAYQINPFLHPALRVAHKHQCPSWEICDQAIEDTLAMEEWAEGEGLDATSETNWYKLQEIYPRWLHTQSLIEKGKRDPRGPELCPDEPY